MTAVIYGGICQLIADLQGGGGAGLFVMSIAARELRIELEGVCVQVGR